MPHLVREGLSYCQIDGRFVFLDLQADRYFGLTGRLNRSLETLLQGRAVSGPALRELVSKGIVIEAQDLPFEVASLPIQLPSRSAIEVSTDTAGASATALIEVAALVASSLLQLKTQPIAHILTKLSSYRDRLTAPRNLTESRDLTKELIESSARFRWLRPFVPITPCCLLDSIALTRFLARRRLASSITFAVALDPFAAHCWVQAGHWVLNDTVGNALAHTPIRSV